MKIVVFDLDETLGYFVEYGIFWDCLKKYFTSESLDFNETLDLFPEFFRPNIMNILVYLRKKKISNDCQKIMIYTNNQKFWALNIISYFETKLKIKLFDQVISAFKINGKQVEVCRTSQDKSYKDFMRCTKLPANAEICFMDNHLYPNMINKNIYYINLKPYVYELNFSIMIARFVDSENGAKLVKDKSNFEEFMMNEYKKYNYSFVETKDDEYEIDKIIGKQIMTHLQDFFRISNTKKNRKHPRKNKTLKTTNLY